jgi:hypothetical protein
MEMAVTVGALVAGAGLVGAMSWIERQPRNLLAPRLVPTTPLMFLGAFVALLAAVHLLTIFGLSKPAHPL